MLSKFMKKLLKFILKFFGILFIRRIVIRLRILNRYLYQPIFAGIKWLPKKTEYSNFYYDLTSRNMEYLANTISLVTGLSYSTICSYFDELKSDDYLTEHISRGLNVFELGKDIEVKFGRRYGWYAITRAIKPKLVIETGVEHGVGSCILASALLRNEAEGFPGRYIGTEISLSSGKLFSGKYSTVGEIRFGDSIKTLEKIQSEIDLFINDSDHSADYEALEYKTIAKKLSQVSIVLGDNSHSTNELLKFSITQGRRFVFFSEKPENHWYPGAGIGISF